MIQTVLNMALDMYHRHPKRHNHSRKVINDKSKAIFQFHHDLMTTFVNPAPRDSRKPASAPSQSLPATSTPSPSVPHCPEPNTRPTTKTKPKIRNALRYQLPHSPAETELGSHGESQKVRGWG
jgi:hypothetical protein